MRFEWHDEKNRVNKAKHKLDFETAIAIFDDPYSLYEANSTMAGETHEQVIGSIVGNVVIVVVVYTVKQEDDGEVYRIISARKANPKERRRYQEAVD